MTNEELKAKIIEGIKTVFDPEIPINVWDLGLIYELTVTDGGKVKVLMTLTAPNCPEAERLPQEVLDRIKEIPEVAQAELEITFEPAWDLRRLSDDAKLMFELI
ncbi:MAG: iron-sulfur cluster assembly protein [Candidatus Kapabacteria bacterium]|nr:iron-sulfur cluster assembly protein [Candidatus Kapabacteria bacterium]